MVVIIWCCSARQYARHRRSHWSSRRSHIASSATAAPRSAERRDSARDGGIGQPRGDIVVDSQDGATSLWLIYHSDSTLSLPNSIDAQTKT